MARLARCIPAVLGFLAAPWAAVVQQGECAAGNATACVAEVQPSISKDHLLMQLNSGIKRKQHARSMCDPATVSRRRRGAEMCSCRRRTGSSNLAKGYMCGGDNSIQSCGDDCPMGWLDGNGPMVAAGSWCEITAPPSEWNLKTCPSQEATTDVKVLTYNLFWWNLFDQRKGDDRKAGKLIAKSSPPEEYDIMAFQECDSRYRVVGDAQAEGLSGEYEAIDGGRAIAIAFRTSRWTLLSNGTEDVGEDDSSQYYGKRSAMWVRLAHKDNHGLVVFFVNHHGPLPVSHGGGCTGSSTAHHIMQVIAGNAHAGDRIILVGDFNAEGQSSRIQELDTRLHRVFSGTSMGGVDHVYTNCESSLVSATNLGKGGSDHDALSVVFKL